MFDQYAHQDFDNVYRWRFWRKIGAWLSGRSNELLPYYEVRKQLPFQGQRFAGLQTIPLDKIVGSVGRYRDFDRAFLPTQKVTSDRWVNVSKAHYEDIPLPAIDVYKIGEVYFVRDGNHRVSVARERKQSFIDAYVTEVEIPITLTAEMDMAEVEKMKDYAQFMQKTHLNRHYPEADLQTSNPDDYNRLINHIEAHAYYMGIERNADVSYEDAVKSWYKKVYSPLIKVIQEQGLPNDLPDYTLTDLYLFISDYQWLLREYDAQSAEENEIGSKLTQLHNEKTVRQILKYLQRKNWLSQTILEKERANFLVNTQLDKIRPEIDIQLSFPGKYDNFLEHINAHHYYLGIERYSDIPFEEAVSSFIDTIYMPLLALIDDPSTLEDFHQRRTEADLVLWVLDHRQDLVQALNSLPASEE